MLRDLDGVILEWMRGLSGLEYSSCSWMVPLSYGGKSPDKSMVVFDTIPGTELIFFLFFLAPSTPSVVAFLKIYFFFQL